MIGWRSIPPTHQLRRFVPEMYSLIVRSGPKTFTPASTVAFDVPHVEPTNASRMQDVNQNGSEGQFQSRILSGGLLSPPFDRACRCVFRANGTGENCPSKRNEH